MRYKILPRWFRQTMAIAGLLLALPGVFIGLGLLCLTLILIVDNDAGAVYAGLIGFTLIMLTAGTGGATVWQSMASLNGKLSKPLRLPPLWGLISIFVLYFVIGVVIYQSGFVTGLFLPPVLLVAAGAPSLIAFVWFADRRFDGLTWRRSIITFAGAATLSLVIFIFLQVIILVTISMLNPYPVKEMNDTIELVFDGMVRRNGLSMMLNQRFTYIFLQITIIVPVIGALAKPLVTLPLIGQLSKRETFLLGAMAGVGFAVVENIFYIDYELRVWPWILIVQAVGGAVHPLGSGLVALGLWEVVRGKPNAWPTWLAFLGIAMALHSLWSLGFLFVITLNSFFLIDEFVSTSIRLGGTIASLIIVSLIGSAVGTLWAGRSIGQQLSKLSTTSGGESVANRLTVFDRGVAIWAFVSLAALLPIGIIGLQNLLR